MGGDQAANVLSQVRWITGGSRKKISAAEIDRIQNPIREQYKKGGDPYTSTARLWDDGIITPWKAREFLSLALSTANNAPVPLLNLVYFVCNKSCYPKSVA